MIFLIVRFKILKYDIDCILNLITGESSLGRMNFKKKNIFNYIIVYFSIFCKYNMFTLNLINAERGE